jgi:hypothetical protein
MGEWWWRVSSERRREFGMKRCDIETKVEFYYV